MRGCHLGRVIFSRHGIEMKTFSQHLIQSMPYRVGPQANDHGKEEVEPVLAGKAVEEVLTKRVAEIVPVAEKDRQPRFFADYRQMNAVAAKDPYPLPRMDESIDVLGDPAVFSKLYVNTSCCET